MYQVMIIEDDPMVASVDKTWVEGCAGFEVVASFRSGSDALSFLRSYPVDLLILDLNIPGMTGLELLAALRAESNPVEVIVASAADAPETFRRTRHLGALDYLLKPFDEARLRQAVALFLRNHKLYTTGTRLIQSELDSVLLPAASAAPCAPLPAKGIQTPTLKLVRDFLSHNLDTERLTNESIAKGTGLSVVSVRRYMGYLTAQGEVSVEMEYHTGGRPVTVYRLL